MLYIWPYIFFFSLPLLTPLLLSVLIPQHLLPQFLRTSSPKPSLPHITVILPILVATLAIVHYNTIVHPFTLADNRHYVFYVFRILLRYPAIKYLAVPIYFLTGWACLTALGPPTTPTTKAATKSSSSKPAQAPTKRPQHTPPYTTATATRASTLLIHLLSTALSLTPAPLVEPRYLILPWLIWRLHLTPASPPPASQSILPALALWFETAWFLLINFATGYLFLYRGFGVASRAGEVAEVYVVKRGLCVRGEGEGGRGGGI